MARKRYRKPRLNLLGKTVGIPASPEKARLETFPNEYPQQRYWVTFDCPEFTCLCPVTRQPDFGRITIRYVPNKTCLEAKSLKLYLHSYRNVGIFGEHLINRILEDVVNACKPHQAEVTGEFNPRGGISLKIQAGYPRRTSSLT